MTELDYRGPDAARADSARAKRRLARRAILVLVTTAAVTSGAIGLRAWWRATTHRVASDSARADVDALFGPFATRVRSIEAARRSSPSFTDAETRWYRLTVAPGDADALVAALADAWRRRVPQPAEGGVPRMGRNAPIYDVEQGEPAARYLEAVSDSAGVPSWWTPPHAATCRVVMLSDTDEFYSHLSRWNAYCRFGFAYVPGADEVYMWERRTAARYPITTPPGVAPAARTIPPSPN